VVSLIARKVLSVLRNWFDYLISSKCSVKSRNPPPTLSSRLEPVHRPMNHLQCRIWLFFQLRIRSHSFLPVLQFNPVTQIELIRNSKYLYVRFVNLFSFFGRILGEEVQRKLMPYQVTRFANDLIYNRSLVCINEGRFHTGIAILDLHHGNSSDFHTSFRKQT
jgi:hypothetical protein